MMLLLGPLLQVLAIMVGLLVFCWILVKFVRPRAGPARILFWTGAALLALFVIITAVCWPRGADTAGFLPPTAASLYKVLAWLAGPALAGVLLLGRRRLWWPVAALLCWVFAVWAGIHQQGVADRLAVAAGRNGPPGDAVASSPPATRPSAYLFAPSFSSNNVSVFDLDTNKRVAVIGIKALGACCAYQTLDHKKVYIVGGLSPYVTAIDVGTLAVSRVTRLDAVMGEAGAPIAGDGKLFWYSTTPKGNVEAIDTATDRIVRSYPKAGRDFTITPDGRTLVSIGPSGDTLVSRRADTGQALGAMKLHVGPLGAMALYSSDDNAKVYVQLLDNPGSLLVVDIRDPSHMAPIASIPLGPTPLVGAFRPGAHQLWLPNAGDGVISVIDTQTNKVIRKIQTGRYVSAVAFNGSKAYVAQSPSAEPPTFASSLRATVTGVVLGALTGTKEGAPNWRPGIDPPAEIVVYDADTYRRLPGMPALPLPSTPFNLEVVPAR